MPFVLKPPVEKKEYLDKTDKMFPDPELVGIELEEWPDEKRTHVIVYQASQAEDGLFNVRFGQLIQEFDQASPTTYRFIHNPQRDAMMLEAAWLTLGGCNILDEDGETPMFRFKRDKYRSRVDMPRRDFELAWGRLPSIVCDEIYEIITSVNLTWGPGGNVSSGG